MGFDRAFARSFYDAVRDSALLTVAHTAGSVEDVAQALDVQRPDALLVCWERMDAMRLQAITRSHPDIGVVVLARALTREQSRALVRCGAVAALERGAPDQVLLAVMLLAGHGIRIEPGSVGYGGGSAQEGHETTGLSARESEVLGLLDCGESPAKIAWLLGVSPDTVKSQTRSIYRKLGVHSRVELRERRQGASGGSAEVSSSGVSEIGSVLRVPQR